MRQKFSIFCHIAGALICGFYAWVFVSGMGKGADYGEPVTMLWGLLPLYWESSWAGLLALALCLPVTFITDKIVVSARPDMFMYSGLQDNLIKRMYWYCGNQLLVWFIFSAFSPLIVLWIADLF